MNNTLSNTIFRLQYDPHSLMPANWGAELSKAPKKYKVYKNIRDVINLPLDSPLIYQNKLNHKLQDIDILSYFLGYSYGLTSLNLQLPFVNSETKNPSLIQFMRRGVASGGGLYPNQIYLYIRDLEDIPIGLYHYDTAHHRLVLLRQGNYDKYLTKILDPNLKLSQSHFLVFISVFFWKNLFKYYNFGYRLLGLDTGFLIGQCLSLAEQFNFVPSTYYYFQDLLLNKFIGLDTFKESVYAALSFTMLDTNNKVRQIYNTQPAALPGVLSVAIEATAIDQDESLEVFPLIKQIHKNSLIKSSHTLLKYLSYPLAENTIINKNFDCKIFTAIKNRVSPGKYFVNSTVPKQTFFNLVQKVALLLNNQFHNSTISADISLYVYINNVAGSKKGIYHYDIEQKKLILLSAGDYSQYLNDNLTYKNFDFNHIPICFHLAASNKFLMNYIGPRGYRITQMLAGTVAQKIQLLSTYWDLGCHPIMSYNSTAIDALYDLPAKQRTTLIQMAVGFFQPPPSLRGTIVN